MCGDGDDASDVDGTGVGDGDGDGVGDGYCGGVGDGAVVDDDDDDDKGDEGDDGDDDADDDDDDDGDNDDGQVSSDRFRSAPISLAQLRASHANSHQLTSVQLRSDKLMSAQGGSYHQSYCQGIPCIVFHL